MIESDLNALMLSLDNYFRVKKSWDNRLAELVELKRVYHIIKEKHKINIPLHIEWIEEHGDREATIPQ